MPVVDTSISVALMLNEPNADAIREWLATATDLHAPDILPVEIANALISAQRRAIKEAIKDLRILTVPH